LSNLRANQKLGEDVPNLDVVLLFLLSVLLEVIQGKVFPSFIWAHLLLVVVVYVGWYSSPFKAALVGTLFGITGDYVMGLYIGINGLSKTLVGFGATYLSGVLASDLGLARVLLFIGIALIDRGLVHLMLVVIGDKWPTISLLSLGLSAFVTGIVMEVFFRLYDKIRFPPTDFRRVE
jgi:rod shape-determining protein MreD